MTKGHLHKVIFTWSAGGCSLIGPGLITEPCPTVAFDKNDALYLRDEADKARHDELERRDAELAQFARIRSKVETAAAMEPYDPGPALKRAKIAKYFHFFPLRPNVKGRQFSGWPVRCVLALQPGTVAGRR